MDVTLNNGESLQPLAVAGFRGGGSRIRTHGALARPTVFKTAAFGRSAIPPVKTVMNTTQFATPDFTTIL